MSELLLLSLPTQGAWIEIPWIPAKQSAIYVAPHTGSVDWEYGSCIYVGLRTRVNGSTDIPAS